MARKPSPRDDARRRAPSAEYDDDEDDRPWLDEAAYEEPSRTLVGRRAFGWIVSLFAILFLGVVVGIFLVSKRESTPIDIPAVGADIPVISAPGAWKTLPQGDDVEGRPVEGQGQILFDAGQGREPDSRIDINSLPEDPLDKPATPMPVLPGEDEMATSPAPPAGKAPKVILPEAQRQERPATPPAPPPVKAPPAVPSAATPASAPAAAGGVSIQLGAFSTQARALTAFKGLSSRFSYLANHTPVVTPTQRDGATLYRLRVATDSEAAAKTLCDRLKLAGESCSVVR